MIFFGLVFLMQAFFSTLNSEKISSALFIGFKSSKSTRNIEVEQNFSVKYHSVRTEFHTIFLKEPYNILKVSKKVCSSFENQVMAVFGHVDHVSLMHIQSICDNIEIPLMKFQCDFSKGLEKTINLYPRMEVLAKIHALLIDQMKWKSLTLLYDNTKSLLRLYAILKKFSTVGISVKFFRVNGNAYDRIILRQIKESTETNVIIDCSLEILEDLLQKALQVGVITDKFNILITSLDSQQINLNPFQFMGLNLTGVRMVDSKNVNNVQDENFKITISNILRSRTEEALFYDAINLFSEAFQRLKHAARVNLKKLSCHKRSSWEYGMSLNNFLKSIQMQGISGPIAFDNEGYRIDFEIEVFKLTYEGIKVVGKWDKTKNLEWFHNESVEANQNALSLRNTTFKVLIALTKPYGMLKETVFKMSGNDQYEGFAIDIIHEISKMLGFNYTFYVQSDNVYGSLNPETGSWNGMLRRIIDNEADLAITDLTITAERETAVDFTMPFMNLGISILYQKPKAAPPSLMSFLLPFSTNVWLYLLGVYIIVSLLFFVIGRMCPAEWNNMYPCIEEPDELENQFTIKNSLWFCMGAIMQQGSEIAPIGNSTRMLAGCWWFFCLIIVSSYTANLAAFLTVETVERPIKNAEDLANQNIIKYGAKKGGSTLGFFKDSNSSTYSKMYQYMMKNSDYVLTDDNDQGKKKVLTENYAFLMESSSIEYIQERECNLTQIGGLLDQKGYGIAMKKNASYRNELSRSVLKLQEMGILTALKNKWWKEKGGGGRCQEESSGGQAEELGLANVGGVFLVLVVGVAVSFILTIFEFMFDTVMNNSDDICIWRKIKQEFRFILRFGISTKPAKSFT